MTFGEKLVGQRERAGFKSARAFARTFAPNGLQMSYANYTRIEAGELAPQLSFAIEVARLLGVADLFDFLMPLLQSTVRTPATRDYLERVLGVNTLGVNTLGTREVAAEPSPQLLKYSQERRHLLTPEQVEAVTRDRDSYWIFLATVLNRSLTEIAELSRRSDIGLRRCEEIVRQLVAVGLLRKVGTRVGATFANLTFPPGFRERTQALGRAISSQTEAPPLFWRSVFLKTSAARMEEFRERANRLAAEFLTFEEVVNDRNVDLYLLTIQVAERADLNFSKKRPRAPARSSPTLFKPEIPLYTGDR